MSGNILHFYCGGNTAKGFANLFDSSLQDLRRLYILKGGPGTGKSGVIRAVGDAMVRSGHDVWYIHCASDNDSLDGVVAPGLGVGIVDGTSPHVVEPRLPGAVEQYVNLGEAWDASALADRRSEIEALNDQIKLAYDRAYAGFAEALRIHDDWEKIYIENMDFEEADRLTREYIGSLFPNSGTGKKSRVDRRFLGAATPSGAVDFVPNLTEGLKRRILIKGRPGSGKSTLLKKVAAAATERGYDVEIYHCGFDPNSLDMVIVRELGFAIFDSTAPHEYFPERESDEILDMYARCIKPGTDEAHADAIRDLKQRYSSKMKESIGHLATAKSLHDELERIYGQAMNFSVVDSARERIRREIDAIAERYV
ncbi:hypothetical protein FE782_08530 [Paenibacillus antri]|uniref:ATPase n=1 Tax=Paenibacillus antri TaxID=2582848 RepID=A0A5R9GE95_9BACL|nr:PRK06851 family protein [Paenibacillus antri]TLS52666.1 hypothetical protein FE782_08530 [Paenibacillus antri]